MHSLEMLQRMNSAKVSGRIRRRAIILNKGGGHAKDAEKGRPMKKNRAGGWIVPSDPYSSIPGCVNRAMSKKI